MLKKEGSGISRGAHELTQTSCYNKKKIYTWKKNKFFLKK